jgi:cyclopropane-fatty-acyl-phospholipid synthase
MSQAAISTGATARTISERAVRSPKRNWYEGPLERGVFPDVLIRMGIRRRLRARLADLRAGGPEAMHERKRALIAGLHEEPIAIETDAANAQHYELPPEFFRLWLGARRKYSCCLYPTGRETLDEAEVAMLDLYCERAQLADGMDILDLGCGWGSLSLHLAAKFPNSRILGVSNSALQREAIEAIARERGLANLEIRTADANAFDPGREFDRVLSVEMFEHMKNYASLLERVSSWLRPEGLLFVHIFTHREAAYHYEAEDDWIGRYFFSGGTMPSDDLLLHFQDHLAIRDHWTHSGDHYRRTAEHWLANYDRNREPIMRVLREAYADEAAIWWNRWRVFILACAELWGLRNGSEWQVSHYLFARR